MAAFIIGLTGGIGSGKTTVSDLFCELDIEVVDADVVARSVVKKGSNALNQIAIHFGDEILLKDGTLDRSALRSKIFSDDVEKAWLNNLLHPLIRTSLLKQLSECSGVYCILSAPLLFENNLQGLTNRSLVIDVPVETQIERTCERDKSQANEVKAIIASQISREKRLKLADDILSNVASDFSKLRKQVLALHDEYLALATALQHT